MSREATSGHFIPEMDGLRFIAIAMVVVFHLNAYLIAKTNFYEHGAGNLDWLCRTALMGFHGVELFFVISGFMLALPFAAHRLRGDPAVNLRSYYMRRLTRLEPPYIVTILVLMFLGFCLRPGSVSPDAHLAASLVYLHNLIYGAPSTVLGVAWSLEIEVQFYVLVPILTLLFALQSALLRRSAIVLVALSAMGAQNIFPHHARFTLSIVGYLQFFLAGFLLADIYLLNWKTSTRQPLYWDLITVVCWPLLFLSLQSKLLTEWLFPGLIFILYCAAFRGRWTSRFLSTPWITVVGGMCYSIYLVHYEVISAIGRFTKVIGEGLPNPIYLVIQFALVGVAIVIVCGLYFLLLEKPCMKRDWPQRLLDGARRLLPSKQAKARATFAS